MPPGYPTGRVPCKQTKTRSKDTGLPLNTPPDFAFTPSHALLSSVFLILYFFGERQMSTLGGASCHPAKNDSDLKSGALEDPIVPDDLAVEAEVARWVHKS